MPQVLAVGVLIIMGGIIGVFAVIVIGIRVEDRRGSATDPGSGYLASGTRWLLGLYVDHTACRYVSNPRHDCPKCRRASANH
ncbi:hypothetical protein IMZ11_01240 [Microtetraspora sp. AC03309]|uniref:hypothetical protein n=1 Tax=Microtetraspora sp. AC03309 TaxID=2779376 RepID=UPI001E3CBAC1|nr:hypothetical protein [Microtetraspora sp. AC03309]MCC5574264.1 hypothetical protein [Microtetraspora sp. AC03309]